MIRELLSTLLLISLATNTWASDDHDAHAEAEYLAQERVLELPQDQDKWYLTLVGDPSDPKYQQACRWFDAHEQLTRIRRGTHYHAISTSSVMYRDRYAAHFRETPCIRLQRADGQVLFQVSGDNLPITADALHQAMRAKIFRRRNRGDDDSDCRPRPSPEPSPLDDPEPQPLDSAPLDTVIKEERASDLPPLWLLATLFAGGAGLGIAQKWRETYYPQSTA